MRALLENPLWLQARFYRKYQRFFGYLSGFLLAVALISLFDGLLEQMRQGSYELDFLPGQAMTISGPVALKNPVNSDVIARFSPQDSPLRFDLEGFFTGYWFGNGMWRGQIIADKEAGPGAYDLSISFKGASAQRAQKYKLRVFADAAQMQAGSFSFIRRFTGVNPFILGAWAGGSGFFCGLVTYWFGRRYGASLTSLGLSEILSSEPDTNSIWCLSPKNLAPGLARMVLDRDGHVFGEARSVSWAKGRLRMTVMDERKIPPGSLVCLRHPDSRPHNAKLS